MNKERSTVLLNVSSNLEVSVMEQCFMNVCTDSQVATLQISMMEIFLKDAVRALVE